MVMKHYSDKTNIFSPAGYNVDILEMVHREILPVNFICSGPGHVQIFIYLVEIQSPVGVTQ